jgi:hypothetical protein
MKSLTMIPSSSAHCIVIIMLEELFCILQLLKKRIKQYLKKVKEMILILHYYSKEETK